MMMSQLNKQKKDLALKLSKVKETQKELEQLKDEQIKEISEGLSSSNQEYKDFLKDQETKI